MRMMNWLTSRKHGVKEVDLIHMTQALILSRVTYAALYLKLTKKDIEQLDIIIKKAYMLVLGLSIYTPTNKLLSLRVHNTYMELAEPQTRNKRI